MSCCSPCVLSTAVLEVADHCLAGQLTASASQDLMLSNPQIPLYQSPGEASLFSSHLDLCPGFWFSKWGSQACSIHSLEMIVENLTMQIPRCHCSFTKSDRWGVVHRQLSRAFQGILMPRSTRRPRSTAPPSNSSLDRDESVHSLHVLPH